MSDNTQTAVANTGAAAEGAQATAQKRQYDDDQVNAMVAKGKRTAEAERDALAAKLATFEEAQKTESQKAIDKAAKDSADASDAKAAIREAALLLDHKLELSATRLGIPEVFMPSVRALLPREIEPKDIATEVAKILDAHPEFSTGAAVETVQPGGPGAGGKHAIGRPWSRSKARASIDAIGAVEHERKYGKEIAEDRRKGVFTLD